MATIRAIGIRGMSNLDRTPASLVDESGVLTPRVVVNADALDGLILTKRRGYTKVVDLRFCHSLWARSVMLCVAEGSDTYQSLYRLEGETAVELCEVSGPRVRMIYEEVGSEVFMGNPYWRAVYDLQSNTVKPWGLPLPPAPQVALADGDLPSGVYNLCYTYVDGNQLSGAGPSVQVRLDGNGQGIALLHRPQNTLCWISLPDGGDFFLARVENEKIVHPYPWMQKLPTLGVIPPPPCSHFAYAFGRIWVASGKNLYYSDPHNFHWFRRHQYLPFLEDLVMVVPVLSGIFVNSRTSTWFLDGTTPTKMKYQRCGDGAVPGTLVYAQLEGGGYEISRKLSQLPSPVWAGQRGMVVGTNNGHVVHMTEARLKMPMRASGASLARTHNGWMQVLLTTRGLAKEEDDELTEIFQNGRLFPPAPLQHRGVGGIIVS